MLQAKTSYALSVSDKTNHEARYITTKTEKIASPVFWEDFAEYTRKKMLLKMATGRTKEEMEHDQYQSGDGCRFSTNAAERVVVLD